MLASIDKTLSVAQRHLLSVMSDDPNMAIDLQQAKGYLADQSIGELLAKNVCELKMYGMQMCLQASDAYISTMG